VNPNNVVEYTTAYDKDSNFTHLLDFVMLSLAIALVSQTLPVFYTIDEVPGDAPPVVGGRLIYTLDVRMIGRRAQVILDTKARALPYKVEDKEVPKSLLEYSVHGLGRQAKRVVSDPESGYFAWVTVLNIKRI
jgi:hypothetical protein